MMKRKAGLFWDFQMCIRDSRSGDQGYDIHEIAITYFGIFADGMALRNPFPDTLGDRDKDYVCQ